MADLKTGLLQAQADGITWKFVLDSRAIQKLGIYHAEDRYDGYAAERTDLLGFINENDIYNSVSAGAAREETGYLTLILRECETCGAN